MKIGLKYGTRILELETDGMRGVKVLEPELPTEIREPDMAEALRSVLEDPNGCDPLSETARPGETWLIVVSDGTRKYGFPLWGPTLLDALNDAGVPDRDVSVLIATGAHASQSKAKQRETVGEQVSDRVEVFEHNCDDYDSMDAIGTTARGTSVEINSMVGRADRVCLTGVVQHHYFAGFTGGRKSLMPGLCSRGSIFANHSLTLHPEGGIHPMAASGVLDGNPVHEDMLEAAMMMPPDFCVNVTAAGNQVYAFFAGHLEAAHREACRWVSGHYEVGCEPAPVVIAGAGGAPKDSVFYQAHKAFDNAFMALAPNGTLILAARCGDGFGPAEFPDWLAIKSLEEIETRLRERYVVCGQTAMRTLAKARASNTILVSELPKKDVQRIGFTPAHSLEEALEIARPFIEKADRITVIPDANMTLPVRVRQLDN